MRIMIEHEVVEVDGLVVEVFRAHGLEAAASRYGVSCEGPNGPHFQPPEREDDEECECGLCLALHTHRRLKEQRNG